MLQPIGRREGDGGVSCVEDQAHSSRIGKRFVTSKLILNDQAGDLPLHVCRVLMLRLVPKELDGINPAREATRR